MDPSTLAVVVILAAAANLGLLWLVIRSAVAAGILHADRMRDQAEAERLRVLAERRRSGE